MFRYIDTDFWKFFLGFVAIILCSSVLVVATRLYQTNGTGAKPGIADSIKH